MAYRPWQSEPIAPGGRGEQGELTTIDYSGVERTEAVRDAVERTMSMAVLRARGGSYARVMQGVAGARVDAVDMAHYLRVRVV